MEKPVYLDLSDSLVFRRIIAVADFIRPFAELPQFAKWNHIINDDTGYWSDDEQSNAYNEQMTEIYNFIQSIPELFAKLMEVANGSEDRPFIDNKNELINKNYKRNL
jgi:hypothetical protein